MPSLAGRLIVTFVSTAAEENNSLRFDAPLHLYLAGMSGDVTAKSIAGHGSSL